MSRAYWQQRWESTAQGASRQALGWGRDRREYLALEVTFPVTGPSTLLTVPTRGRGCH